MNHGQKNIKEYCVSRVLFFSFGTSYFCIFLSELPMRIYNSLSAESPHLSNIDTKL